MKYLDREKNRGGVERARDLSIECALLRRLAGRRIYRRGEEYARCGLVLDSVESRRNGETLVAGTQVYRAGLWREADEVVYYCDCPMGLSNRVCKHIVALGIFRSGKDGLRRRVLVCERGLEQAIHLLGGKETDQLGREWRDRTVVLVDELLTGGQVKAVFGLIERTLGKIAEARWQVGEAEAMNGERSDFVGALCERLIDACRRSGFRMPGAARRFLDWQMKLVGAGFKTDLLAGKLQDGYARLFGDEWRAVYRRLIVERHMALHKMDDGRLDLAARRQLRWLSHWLEGKGMMSAESDRSNSDRTEDTIEAAWQNFKSNPTQGEYLRLKECALLRSQWADWRQRALDYLRDRSNQALAASSKRISRAARKGVEADCSGLVGILLAEGEIEEAWSAAQQGGCSDELWLKLAALRVRHHPEEALVVYQRLVRRLLGRKDRYSAQEANRVLRKVRRLLKRLGCEEDFADFVSDLQRSFGAQRNFAEAVSGITVE